jgi:hypothetical protein
VRILIRIPPKSLCGNFRSGLSRISPNPWELRSFAKFHSLCCSQVREAKHSRREISETDIRQLSVSAHRSFVDAKLAQKDASLALYAVAPDLDGEALTKRAQTAKSSTLTTAPGVRFSRVEFTAFMFLSSMAGATRVPCSEVIRLTAYPAYRKSTNQPPCPQSVESVEKVSFS